MAENWKIYRYRRFRQNNILNKVLIDSTFKHKRMKYQRKIDFIFAQCVWGECVKVLVFYGKSWLFFTVAHKNKKVIKVAKNPKLYITWWIIMTFWEGKFTRQKGETQQDFNITILRLEIIQPLLDYNLCKVYMYNVRNLVK